MLDLKIKDSGERETYSSGAQRDNSVGKGRFDLLPGPALLRISRWFQIGALKYSERNWEKGMPISRYLDAAFRHLVKYMMGCDDEDHLSAASFNIMAIMHHEYYSPEMQNLPGWKDRRTRWMYDVDLGNTEENK